MPDPEDFVIAQQQAAAAFANGGNSSKPAVAWQQSGTIQSQPALQSASQGMCCKNAAK